jgi:sigma-E factor negative regulatory protein RseA
MPLPDMTVEPNQMTDQIREQMSALLDGELPKGEVDLLVRRMARDAELKRAFGNYVLAGESLRAPGGVMASRGFAARVSAAIDAEDGVVGAAAPAAPARAPIRWRRPLAASAVAASAALAAVLLVRPDSGDSQQFAERSGAPATVPLVALPVGGASPTPAQNQRLAGYLVTHGQYATPMGRRNAWSNALATDPGIARATPEPAEAR